MEEDNQLVRFYTGKCELCMIISTCTVFNRILSIIVFALPLGIHEWFFFPGASQFCHACSTELQKVDQVPDGDDFSHEDLTEIVR